MDPRFSRAYGALAGLALGDALGMPTQAMSPEQIRAVYGRITGLVDGDASQPYAPGMPAGSVTDDTEQALLVASLLVRGRGSSSGRVALDAGEFAHALLAWEDSMIERGEMLEWALVHGKNKYGTPRGPVDQALAAGEPVLLEIDLAGARQVKVNRPDAQFIFLAPPSWEELERRLLGRGTEGPEERERRLATARVELEAASEFDHVVINDDVERAVGELAGLIGLE